MAEMTQEQFDKLVEQNNKLTKQLEDMNAFIGKQGREIGELRKKTSDGMQVVDRKTGASVLLDDSNYDTEKEVEQFAQNPRGYIKKFISAVKPSEEIVEDVNRLKNDVGYLVIINDYPEFKDKEVQKKVFARQDAEAAAGRTISTVDALEKLRFEAREAELKTKEAKLKSGDLDLSEEKKGIAASAGGQGTGGIPPGGTKDKTTAEKVWEGVKKYKPTDNAPF